jgi:hypothetical protein
MQPIVRTEEEDTLIYIDDPVGLRVVRVTAVQVTTVKQLRRVRPAQSRLLGYTVDKSGHPIRMIWSRTWDNKDLNKAPEEGVLREDLEKQFGPDIIRIHKK